MSKSPGNFAAGFSTSDKDQGVRFGGFHSGSGHLLVVIDEATGVAEKIWAGIEGLRSAGEVCVVAAFNPLRSSGPMYEASRSGRWFEVRLNCFESPNFEHFSLDKLRSLSPDTPEDDPVFAYKPEWSFLARPRWAAEMFWEYGEASAMFQSRVLDAWPRDIADNQLIALSDVEAATKRWKRERGSRSDEPIVFGVDVARFSSAKTVVMVRQRSRVIDIQSWSGVDTMQTCGRIVLLAERYDPESINIDEIGVGTGPTDRLIELGRWQVIRVKVGSSASWLPGVPNAEKAYANLKVAISWHVMQLFRAGEISIPPGYPQLVADLTALTYGARSDGKITVENKQSLMARGVASPDFADSLFLAFIPTPGSPMVLWRYYQKRETAEAGRERAVGPKQCLSPQHATVQRHASDPGEPSEDDRLNADRWWRERMNDPATPPPAGYEVHRSLLGRYNLFG